MKRRQFIGTIAAGSVFEVVFAKGQDNSKPTLFFETNELLNHQQINSIFESLKPLKETFQVFVLQKTKVRVVGQATTFYSSANGCHGKTVDGFGNTIEGVQWCETQSELVGIFHKPSGLTDVYHIPGLRFIPQ